MHICYHISYCNGTYFIYDVTRNSECSLCLLCWHKQNVYLYVFERQMYFTRCLFGFYAFTLDGRGAAIEIKSSRKWMCRINVFRQLWNIYSIAFVQLFVHFNSTHSIFTKNSHMSGKNPFINFICFISLAMKKFAAT